MFFPEPIKKITQLKETDGFLYFDPQDEVESYLIEQEKETAVFRTSLNYQHKVFIVLSLIVAALNILILAYWTSKLGEIYSYQPSNSSGDGSEVNYSTIPAVILVLLVFHFVWVNNTFLGYTFLRYELNSGIIFYFVSLNLILFTRIALNLFIIVSTSQLNLILGASYSVGIYVIVIILQAIGDVGLAMLAAKIKYTIKQLSIVVDKKLYSQTISNVTVL